VQALSVTELALWIAEAEPGSAPQLLDVREPWECEIASIEGSVAIPMGEIPTRFAELDPGRPVVCICHHGVRSMQVAFFLQRQGFHHTINLTGGIDAWSKVVDSSCASY
jgi:rhodanese-related sulfurtransferase